MDTKRLDRSQVYGATQRLIHAWIGITVVALVCLGWISKAIEPGSAKLPLVQAHIFLGYALVAGLVARLVWGWIGPEHARMSALMHPVAWAKALAHRSFGKSHAFGHDPFASITYLILYGALGSSAVSGLALAGMSYDRGPLAASFFDEFRFHQLATMVHEAVLYGATGFTLLHIGALIVQEKRRGYPIAQAMISGYQYRPSDSEEKVND